MWFSDSCQMSPSALKERFCVVVFSSENYTQCYNGNYPETLTGTFTKKREEQKINKSRKAEKKENLK